MRTFLVSLICGVCILLANAPSTFAQSERTISPRVMELRAQAENQTTGAEFREGSRQSVNCRIQSWHTQQESVRVICANSRLFVDFSPAFFHPNHPVCGAIAVAEPSPQACSEFYQAERHAFIDYLERRLAAGQNINVRYQQVEGRSLFHPIERYGVDTRPEE